MNQQINQDMTEDRTNAEPAKPEPLPRNIISEFITPHFERTALYRRLAEEFGSPLFIVDPAVLRERAARFKSVFEAALPDIGVYYAMKSNNLPYLSRVLLDCGLGLDVSSGVELAAALELGATDIIFSGPGKTVAELSLAAAHPDRVTLLLDSPGELDRLMPLLNSGKGRRSEKGILKLGIRINTNPEGLWRKFGVLPDRAADLVSKIQTCAGVRFTGFQFHSSWNMTPSRQVDGIRALGEMLRSLPRQMLGACEFIDIGGGYWPEQGEWLVTKDPLAPVWHRAAPIETYARDLSRAVKEWIFPLVQCRSVLSRDGGCAATVSIS